MFIPYNGMNTRVLNFISAPVSMPSPASLAFFPPMGQGHTLPLPIASRVYGCAAKADRFESEGIQQNQKIQAKRKAKLIEEILIMQNMKSVNLRMAVNIFFVQARLMENSACPFGPFFRRERQVKSVSLWQVVHRLNYYLANLQRIESGRQQPGVGLAFRMIDAIDVNAGDFMARLAADNFERLPVSVSSLAKVLPDYVKPGLAAGRKSMFGPMLLQARMAAEVSQTAMSKASGYSLRNLNAVEKGIQEPGIMTALALVLTTGVEVGMFFSLLFNWWKEFFCLEAR